MPDSKQIIADAIDTARQALCSPGDWLTGAERRAAWHEARDARSNPLDLERQQAISPNAVAGAHAATADLQAEAVEVVHRVATDPGRLTQAWADQMIEVLGDTTYTELVGVTALALAVDTFAWATTGTEPAIGVASPGEPARIRPDTVGEVGAWVHQTTDAVRANVSRALSLVPVTNAPWVNLVDSLYSRGRDFAALEWDHRPLSRPQVELVAARTTAEMECFY